MENETPDSGNETNEAARDESAAAPQYAPDELNAKIDDFLRDLSA